VRVLASKDFLADIFHLLWPLDKYAIYFGNSGRNPGCVVRFVRIWPSEGRKQSLSTGLRTVKSRYANKLKPYQAQQIRKTFFDLGETPAGVRKTPILAEAHQIARLPGLKYGSRLSGC
jgi:hypothetical protein